MSKVIKEYILPAIIGLVALVVIIAISPLITLWVLGKIIRGFDA